MKNTELIEALRNPDHPNYREASEKAADLLEKQDKNPRFDVVLNEAVDPDAKIQSINAHALVERDSLGISIGFDGYGVCDMAPGTGDPIFIELYEGKVRIVVWSDINDENAVHIIDLSGAQESNREE